MFSGIARGALNSVYLIALFFNLTLRKFQEEKTSIVFVLSIQVPIRKGTFPFDKSSVTHELLLPKYSNVTPPHSQTPKTDRWETWSPQSPQLRALSPDCNQKVLCSLSLRHRHTAYTDRASSESAGRSGAFIPTVDRFAPSNESSSRYYEASREVAICSETLERH